MGRRGREVRCRFERSRWAYAELRNCFMYLFDCEWKMRGAVSMDKMAV